MILECYNLLKQIQHRPAMWTGETSLRSICIYICGYYHALFDNKLAEPQTEEPFFDWVAKKLGYFESTAGWANMILAYCMGFEPKDINWNQVLATPATQEQHIKSINLFYDLVDEFKDEIEKNEVKSSTL